MKKFLINRLNICRLSIVKKMFTEDEKYLIQRAIEDRVENLERILVRERWADRDNIYSDIDDYKELGDVFSTRHWH
jgi:hypothetical protein